MHDEDVLYLLTQNGIVEAVGTSRNYVSVDLGRIEHKTSTLVMIESE